MNDNYFILCAKLQWWKKWAWRLPIYLSAVLTQGCRGVKYSPSTDAFPKYFHCAYSSVYYSPSYSTFCYIALATLHAKHTSSRPEVALQNWISSQNLKKKNVFLFCVVLQWAWISVIVITYRKCFAHVLFYCTGTDNYQLILVPFY